jgi:hypothetical protein
MTQLNESTQRNNILSKEEVIAVAIHRCQTAKICGRRSKTPILQYIKDVCFAATCPLLPHNIRKEIERLNNMTLEKFLPEFVAWADDTFAKQTKPGLINHMRRELNELEADLDNSKEAKEVCDIMTLLFHFINLSKYDFWTEMYRKFYLELKQRRWPTEPDELGVYHHIVN